VAFPINTSVFDPNADWRKYWDMLMMFLLLFCAFVTPFEIAFISSVEMDGLYFLNKSIDVLFFNDMCFNFNTGYFNFKTGMWVVRRQKICVAYMKSWFLIDLISIIPFDLLNDALSSDPESAGKNLMLLRLVRVLRLAKLFRVLRASRIMQRWQTKISISFGMQTVIKSFVITFVAMHWSACLIRLISDLERENCRTTCFDRWLDTPDGYDYLKRGLYNYTYSEVTTYCANDCKDMNWLDKYGFAGSNSAIEYIAALYWSIVVLKGTDFQSINISEYGLSIVIMVLGGGVYAMMIGDVSNVIANLDEAGNEYKRVMDNLNAYMNTNHFDEDLKVKLRAYFQHCRALFRNEYHHATLAKMSPVLRGEVANHENGGWVVQIPFFSKAPRKEQRDLITDISLGMKQEVYVSGDTIVARGSLNKEMFVVDRGMAVMNVHGKMPQFLSMGSVFGDDIIIRTVTDNVQQRRFQVVAMTYVDCHTLDAQKLMAILTNGSFPETYKAIRRVALKLLLRTHFPPFLRKQMDNPDITTFHELVEQMTGTVKEVDVAIEQRVEEGAVVMAGLKPEEMNQIMKRFDGYVRNQKALEKIVNSVLSECKTVRRDVFEWTEMMSKQEEERLDALEAEASKGPPVAQPSTIVLNGGGGSGGQAGAGGGGGETPNIDLTTMGPPGQITMMSVPMSLVPPELLPKPKRTVLGDDDDDDDDDDDETGFAAADRMKQALDRVKILETRIKNLSTQITTAKKIPEMRDELGRMKDNVEQLEQKHREMRTRVRDEIRTFNQRKEERILRTASSSALHAPSQAAAQDGK